MHKENKPPLHYHHGSWWHVEGTAIWYLPGKTEDNRPIGWYFNDEAGGINGPYDCRAEAETALENYRSLNYE